MASPTAEETIMKTWKNILLLFGSLIFLLLLAEGVLRFFPLLRPLPRTYVGEYENRTKHTWMVADPSIGWKFGPSSRSDLYQVNAQGFRGNSDFSPSQPCKIIALAGDSVTFGVGLRYEQIYASLTEAGLPGICVDDMAMAGFGLDQIWQTVLTQALPLHPRLVIVAFTSSAFTFSEEAYRPIEGFNKPTFKLVDGQLLPKTPQDRPNSLVRFLQRHSSLWRVGRLADRAVAHKYPHGEWWYLNAAILDAIQADCRNAGVPLLFIYIPSREWKGFPALNTYMARSQANFIDLSQGDFALIQSMYVPRDGHLNEKGHRQVADAILHWLQQNLPAVTDPPK